MDRFDGGSFEVPVVQNGLVQMLGWFRWFDGVVVRWLRGLDGLDGLDCCMA